MNETKKIASGEILIPALQSTCERGVAIYKNKINILGKGWENAGINEGWPLVHQQYDLKRLTKKHSDGKSGLDLIDLKSFEKPENWTKEEMYIPKYSTSGDSGSLAHPALTASPTDMDMWAFYQGKERSQELPLIGRQYTLNEDEVDAWGPPISMKMKDGTLIQNIGSVCAHYFGTDQIILVAGGYVGMSSDYPAAHHDSLLIAIFNRGDIDEKNNSWKAMSSQWFNKNSFKFFMGENEVPLIPGDNFGKNISFDWFLDTSSIDEKKKEQPRYGMAINFSPIASGNTSYISPTIFISLITDKDTGKIQNLEKGRSNSMLRATAPYTGESCLMRDPAGRLRSYGYYPAVGGIYPRYYNTSQFPNPKNNFGSSEKLALPMYPLKAVPTLAEAIEIMSIVGILLPDFDYQILPRGVFYIFTDGGTSPEKGKEDYPILEFTCYNRNRCQLNYYGKVRTVSKTTSRPPKKTDSGPIIIIGGIVDGPIPIPLENYYGYELSAGTTEAGTLNYTNKEDKDKEKSLETSWTAGFESEGKTTEGVGPAWKISVEGGMGSVMTKSTGTETDHSLQVPATIISHGDFKEPEIEKIGVSKVLAAEFQITGCQFFDASNALINDCLVRDPQVGPKVFSFITTMVGSDESFSFHTYSAIPGNLESYTPEKLNEKMNSLGYKGKDYFKDVITANAFPFTENEPYLIFKWNRGAVEGSGFTTFKSSFQEQKWTFESSLYAGVSGGGGIDFFGMGEEFETSFLVGASYSRENSEATTNKTSWGIEIEGNEGWGGPPNRELKDAPDSVKSYSFRLYFLPVPAANSGLPPNYWTKELIDNSSGGDRIDPHSGAWRIVYVVTRIVYNDPNKPSYPPDGSSIS